VSLDHLRHGSPPYRHLFDRLSMDLSFYNLTSAGGRNEVADLRQLFIIGNPQGIVPTFVIELFPTWRNSPIDPPLTWPDSAPTRY
jgi:hypothetical protein